MKIYIMRETADANVKSCGAWLHYKTTLVGVAPGWWYKDRSSKRPFRKLGINILSPARHYDRFQFLTVEIGRHSYGIYREQIDGPVHFGICR